MTGGKLLKLLNNTSIRGNFLKEINFLPFGAMIAFIWSDVWLKGPNNGKLIASIIVVIFFVRSLQNKECVFYEIFKDKIVFRNFFFKRKEYRSDEIKNIVEVQMDKPKCSCFVFIFRDYCLMLRITVSSVKAMKVVTFLRSMPAYQKDNSKSTIDPV